MSFDFVEWFDPYDVDHIKAYQHLCEEGSWPKGFVLEGAVMVPAWQVVLASKIARCWVQKILTENW